MNRPLPLTQPGSNGFLERLEQSGRETQSFWLRFLFRRVGTRVPNPEAGIVLDGEIAKTERSICSESGHCRGSFSESVF